MKLPNREKLLKYSQNKISKEMCLNIIPVAKPRMTQADKWKKRLESSEQTLKIKKIKSVSVKDELVIRKS